MKAQLFAPVIVILFCLLCLIGIDFALPQTASSDTQVANYIIKPVQAERVFYVQPRLSLGNLEPELLWASLEHMAQRYYIRGSKLEIRKVNGRDIPGLIVFTAPLSEETASAELIATGN